MSRPPTLAASRNISACNVQAVSQVGWRLIVASSAKISRPRAPLAVDGPSARTFSMKLSISGFGETGAGVCRPSFLMKKFYTETTTGREFCHSSYGSKIILLQLIRELGNYVVNLQRLVHDRVPFCTGRGASSAILA